MRRAPAFAIALAALASCGGNLTHTWQLSGGGELSAALASASSVLGCGATAAPSGNASPRESALCEAPSMQLSFTTRAQGSARIEVREVRVRDGDSGQLLGLRGVTRPQRWTGSAYAPWDEVVTASSAPQQVRYELTFPTAAGNGVLPSGKSSTAWGVRIEVDLVVDGVVGTITYETLRHAPDVVS